MKWDSKIIYPPHNAIKTMRSVGRQNMKHLSYMTFYDNPIRTKIERKFKLSATFEMFLWGRLRDAYDERAWREGWEEK